MPRIRINRQSVLEILRDKYPTNFGYLACYIIRFKGYKVAALLKINWLVAKMLSDAVNLKFIVCHKYAFHIFMFKIGCYPSIYYLHLERVGTMGCLLH